FWPSASTASSELMKESSSSPVIPCGSAAQSRQRYGASMAALNFLLDSAVSSSRCCSRSSRNFRNMIQVRSGRRSRSPFRPLSLRMISRADFRRLPSIWEVVIGAASAPFFLIRAIEQSLQVVYGSTKLIGAAEQLDDFGGLAVG